MASETKPHAICGAKKRNGEPCRSRQMANGRCRMHGGVATGPIEPANQSGNAKARTHGLFSRSLGTLGREVYEQAESLDEAKLAREAAQFALAKVAEAYGGGAEAKGIIRMVDEFLDQLIQTKAASPDAVAYVRRKLTEPDIGTLGKALSPLKGLLDFKAPPAADAASGGFVISPAKSDDWKDHLK